MKDLNVLDLIKPLLIGQKVDVYFFYPKFNAYLAYNCNDKGTIKKSVIVLDVSCVFEDGSTRHCIDFKNGKDCYAILKPELNY